jgi:1-deoxy-D-xylulose-5-phosphate reductoisomerase
LPTEQIEVVIHPQSIIHSSVYYDDGSTLSQLGNPDMRTVIAYALSYPDRITSGVAPLDLTSSPPLEFYAPDLDKFACLKLAFDALKQGGSAMGSLNAANEIAVEYFLNHKIGFLDIVKIVERTLSSVQHTTLNSLNSIIANDKMVRKTTRDIIRRL